MISIVKCRICHHSNTASCVILSSIKKISVVTVGCSSSGEQTRIELERLREFDLNAAYGPCTGIFQEINILTLFSAIFEIIIYMFD